MGKILRISLKLNFTPNTSGFYGLVKINVEHFGNGNELNCFHTIFLNCVHLQKLIAMPNRSAAFKCIQLSCTHSL